MNSNCNKIVILLFVSILQGLQFSNNPIFKKEEIEIDILGDNCIINGSYYFKNNSKNQILNRILFYPFPINNDIEYPDSIAVFNPHNKRIPFTRVDRGILFKINIPPLTTVLYKITLYQRTKTRRYEYILSTTQIWKHPLSSADFVISLPKNLSLRYLSFKYNRMEEFKEYKKYIIHRDLFYPSNNLIIEW